MNISLNATAESVIRVYLDIPDCKGSLVSFVGAIKSYNGSQITLHPQHLLYTNKLPINNVTIDSEDESYVVIKWSSVVAWEYVNFSYFTRNYKGDFAPYCDPQSITSIQIGRDFPRVAHGYNEDRGFSKGIRIV